MHHADETPPPGLGEEDLAMLAAYRDALGPDRGRLERLGRALEAELVGGGATVRTRSGRSIRALLGAGLAAAAVVLIGGTWMASAVLDDRDRVPADLAQRVVDDTEEARRQIATAPPSSTRSPTAAPRIEPVAAVDEVVAPPPVLRAAPSTVPPRTGADPTAVRRPDVGEETEILARARRALAAGDLTQARSALAEHAGRHADGAMSEEREALVAIVDCRARPSRDRAEAFAARHPRSAYRERVAEACDGSAPPRTIDDRDPEPRTVPVEKRP